MPHKNKEVAKAYFKAYNEKRKDKQKEYLKEHYSKHREEYLARAKRQRESNPEFWKEYKKEYAIKNAPILKVKRKLSRAENLEKYRERERKQYWTPKGLELKLKRRFGITLDYYNGLLSKQYWVCAICFTSPAGVIKRLSVDHCHKTNKVRGLLCSNCNAGLGLFSDSKELLANAIYYLETRNTNEMALESDKELVPTP